MGCSGCSTGRGCSSSCSSGSCSSGCSNKLNSFNWLAGMELPSSVRAFDIVEVRFKNTRKDFFKTNPGEELLVGDIVAVEAASGHDIGVVSLTGELVRIQMNKKNANPEAKDIKKIYRKAKQTDIDKWVEAQKLEKEVMLESRKIAQTLGLSMKISDVEYQGDKTKAIFYYTADDRVDFRELIKRLADTFKVRIEMKQIGSRQEASRLGGIGSCGRELCCSTWLTDFRSVSTSAAKYQQLSLNPLKLAGQCGKLKCCLNYELDAYMEAIGDFPDNFVKLQTDKGPASHQKSDIFRRTMWYTYDNEFTNDFIPLGIDRVHEIIKMNKEGKKPSDLKDYTQVKAVVALPDFENVVGQDSINRFDKKKGGGNKNQKGGGNRPKHNFNKPREKGAAPAGNANKPEGQKPNPNQGKPNPNPNKPNPNQNKPNPNQNRPTQNKSNLNPNRNKNPNRFKAGPFNDKNKTT